MSEYLLFDLSAPMGAFGSYAGHERRGSEIIPPRSAILGLLGAALGIERADRDGQAALRRFGVAIRLLAQSAPLRDFHTVQTVPAKIRRPGSRRNGLERAAIEIPKNKFNPIITVRDYRTDVAFAVAVWSDDALWPLSQVKAALLRPAFVLYLGRKSCPLAAPLGPRIGSGPDPVAVLRSVSAPDWLHATPGGIASDPFPGGSPDWTEQAPTEPVDRGLWHFGERKVWHFDREASL